MAVTNYYTMNGQIVGESTGGVRMAYHRDALGSVVATTDQNQNVTTTARYAAYGTAFATAGNYSTLRFGWCGSLGYRKTQRSGAGLLRAEAYLRARHYSTASARWTAVDPLTAFAGEMPYVYGAAAPTVDADPSGLLSCHISTRAQPAGNCGRAVMVIDWVLTSRETNGWIVQHAKFHGSVQDCGGHPVIPLNYSDIDYYEAWLVLQGTIYECRWNNGRVQKIVASDDEFLTYDEGVCRQGSVGITGYPKLVRGALPASFRCQRVPWAHYLWSSFSAPPGWSDSRALYHKLEVKRFACCCDPTSPHCYRQCPGGPVVWPERVEGGCH